MLKIIKNEHAEEFEIRERCSVIELLNQDDVPDISVAHCRVRPGITTELHALKKSQEIYVILAGTGDVDDGIHPPRPVSINDVVIIPADHPQRIKNTGDDDIIILAICTERFLQENYIPME